MGETGSPVCWELLRSSTHCFWEGFEGNNPSGEQQKVYGEFILHQAPWQLIPVSTNTWESQEMPQTQHGHGTTNPQRQERNQSFPRGTAQQREPTFLAESSKEFFTAEPSHLSIFTGLSSIFHCNGNSVE